MRLPTTSFSRSRLRVSTSGSSGTGAHLFVRPGLRAVTSRRQRSPGLGGRRLLGLLLRPTLARAALLLVDVDGGVEALGVVGPVLADLVVGEGVDEVVGDDEAEHGVTEELEALVGLAAGGFRAP